MFIKFFYTLRQYGVPVSTGELLDLIDAIQHGIVFANMDEFYQLARLIMVKDERYFDKFDRAFQHYIQGISSLELDDILSHVKQIPNAWLELELAIKNLSPEERAKLQKANSLEELLDLLQQRLNEQKGKHQGGNKWIGTGGTSPFGHSGDHPEGIRIGGESRKRSAVKVWEQRQYRNLDDEQHLSNRQMQLALRRLRKFARQGSADFLDIDATIKATAQKGILDIQMIPERRNSVKVLMLFDIGGSMDNYIYQCEQLFSACKLEFKRLDYFYFHNCIYDYVWKDNQRRQQSRINTWDLLNTYGADYKVIIVGDASMAPYEIKSVGGSVEYMNDETGEVWLKRLVQHFDKVAWLNPEDERYWSYTASIAMIQQLFKMYPMTLKGIEEMTTELAK